MKLIQLFAFEQSKVDFLCLREKYKRLFISFVFMAFLISPILAQVNLISNGDMESSSGWKIYNLASSSNATYEFNYTTSTPAQGNGGCLRITSDNPTDILFWKKSTLKGGEVYTVDGAIKINNVASFWSEIYLSTIPPIEGSGYTPNNNSDVIEGFSTWAGCAANIDGTFTSNACTGKGSFTVPGPVGEEVAVYFGFKTGSMANPLPNSLEVLVDNLQLLRAVGTGNSITSLSLGSLSSSSITIPGNVRVSQLKSALQVSAYASFDVTSSSGVSITSTSTVTSNMQVRVTSESGSLKIYTIGTSGLISIENLNNYNATVTSFQNRIVNIGGASNITVNDNLNPLTGSILNLTSQDVWLYFPNIRPSRFSSKYMGNLLINGAEAIANSNVRVVQYLQGTMVISQPSSYQGLTVYSDINTTGTSKSCGNYTYYRSTELGSMDNNIQSFVLKKGYMATFAVNEDGTGISKNYVADKSDIVINQIPEDLNNNVSFIRVFPWRWVNKKGWAGSQDGAAALECGWHYDWDNVANSSLDVEYIPMRHNEWWNAYSNINNKLNTTHSLGFNEPDRPDQANLTVDRAIQLWPEMLKSGLRVGSPCPSDGNPGWVFDFIKKADELQLRVDYVAVHWYKGGQTAQQFYDWLKWIHNNTGRPIWITEWNNGANWTCCLPTYEEQATDVAAFIHMFDTTSFVERYALYEWVQPERYMFYEYATTFTPAGEVYRDNESPIAFSGSYEDGIIPGHAYNIVARHSGKPLEIENASIDNNAIVQQNSSDGGDHQKWKFYLTTDGYYQIVNVNSGKALDVGGTANGSICQQYSYWGGSNQQWAVTDIGNGYYKITSRTSGRSLDVAGQSTTDGADVIIWDYWGGNNQQFKLENLVIVKSAKDDLPEISSTVPVSIYPNPVSNYLSISTSQTIQKTSIYSSKGDLVLENSTPENETVDVSSLKTGIYVIKIELKDSVSTMRFIKID